MKRRKILSFAMALVMCISMCMPGLTAYATDSGDAPPVTSVCTCTDKCTEGNPNPDCDVCGAEGADLSKCTGKEFVCNCTTMCAEGSVNPDCKVCNAAGADLSDCVGLPPAAPIPLSGDDLPTEDAKCSYVSNKNSQSGSNVTLSAAVDVLNNNGGGTITVTSSGLVDNSIQVSTPIVLVAGESDVKIVMEPPTDPDWWVDIYSMFLLAEGGVITFGKSDRESGDPVLTISGNNWTTDHNASSIVYPDSENPAQGTKENPNVILYDGVILENCSDAVLRAPVVAMHGGFIRNTEKKGSHAIYATRYVLMDGGIIENIYAIPVVAYESKDPQDPDDGTAVLTGTAIIRNCNDDGTRSLPGALLSAGAVAAYNIQISGEVQISNCSGDDTGAAMADNNIQMSGNAKISNCTGSGTGALNARECVELSGNAQILNCTGHRLSGGIFATTVNLSGNSRISGCKVTPDGASKTISGGGVYSQYHFSMCDSATIENCSGYTGGGVFLADNYARQDSISGNAKIINNRAVKVRPEDTEAGDGGGVFLAGGSLTVSGNAQIAGNHADSGRGGGIFVGTADTQYDASQRSGIITLQDNAKIANNAAETGAGVYLSGMLEGRNVRRDRAPAGQLTMNGGSIAGNTAKENGGGVYVDASIDPVDPLYVTETALEQAALIVNGGSIQNNKAVNGAGVYVVGYWDKISGESITKPGVLYLNDGSITGNIATENGGGVYIYGHRTSVSDEAELFELKMTGGMIQKNIADKNGGGIFTDGSDTYSLTCSPRLLLSGGSITQNKAVETGGGLYLHYLSNAMLSGVITVDQNEAAIAPNAFLDWNGEEQSEVPPLSDLQAAYEQGKDAFKTFVMGKESNVSNEISSRLESVSTVYDNASPEEIATAISNNPTLQTALGQYVVEGKYTGSKPQFLAAYEDYLKWTAEGQLETMYSAVVSEQYTLQYVYNMLWGSFPQYKIASFTVTDSNAAGSRIGIITEDPHNGRVVAKGDSRYTVRDEDLAAFFSEDATWKIVRLSEQNQLVLERSYIITATAGDGGSISPNGSVSIPEGGNQTFSITADSGYHISDVVVDSRSVGAVSTYTFDNVTANHTISVTFQRTGGGGGGTTRYTIAAEAGDGGSISPSGRVSVTAGADRTFTITADDGYVIADVIVDGESMGAVSTYTFENVRKSHTIEAVFEEESGVADPDDTGVSDLLNTQDHKEYLHGYDTGLFGPNNDMTRAEAAQMFYNLLLDKDVPITVNFSDVPADAWYATAVNTLASLGLVEGVGNNEFAPDRAITRAEFTVIAMRFTNGDVSGENIFSDVSTNDWFYDQVVGSIQYGWITGYEDGTFRPNTTIARAEVTTIVNRMLGRSADVDYVDRHKDDLRLFPDVSQDYWAYYQIVEATNAHDYTKEGNTESWSKLK